MLLVNTLANESITFLQKTNAKLKVSPGTAWLISAPELGHLTLNQQMGLLFMDFDTSDTSYQTGTAELVWGEDKTLLIKGVGRVIWVSLKRG